MTRFVVDGGEIIAPGGEVIGRIVAIDLELASPTLQRSLVPTTGRHAAGNRATLSADPGATGNSAVSSGANLLPKENQVKEVVATLSRMEREAIQRVWDLYVEIFASRRQLDSKRTRIIRDALRTMRGATSALGLKDRVQTSIDAELVVTEAVRGLRVSPWHNGENPQRKKYTEIRYALKGIGDESDDERIEKMATLNAIHGSGGFSTSTASERIERWLDAVRYTVQFNSERERGREAYGELVARGFTVTKLDRAPWARLHR